MKTWKITSMVGTDENNIEKIVISIKENTYLKAMECFKKQYKDKYPYLKVIEIRRIA